MMLLAPVTNSEPHGLKLAGSYYVMRHGIRVHILNLYGVSHLQRYSVTVRVNVTSCTQLNTHWSSTTPMVAPRVMLYVSCLFGYIGPRLAITWLTQPNYFTLDDQGGNNL
jgi:hypothetical protein